MSNPADICRECEVPRKTRELEEENMSLRKAGHRLAKARLLIRGSDEEVDNE